MAEDLQHGDYLRYSEARERVELYYAEAVERSISMARQRLLISGHSHRWLQSLKSSVIGTVLMCTFERKQSTKVVELLPTCHPRPIFCCVAFRSWRVTALLFDLDAHGGTDSLGLLPSFYKEVARSLDPDLFRLYQKLHSQNVGPNSILQHFLQFHHSP